MANETPRMKITYPAIGEGNYFDNYQAGMNDIDAGIFATWSAINTIPNGGGTLTWALVGPDYTLTWTSLIAFQTPAFGSTQSIASGSIEIPKGLLIYTDLSYGATTGSTALTFTVASQVPVDTASLAFAWHNPVTDQLHFATGLVLALGDTATGIQPQGGGGGGSISVTDTSVTVNPATTLTFTAGAVAINDAGGGNAEAQVQLTTKFVVSADGSTFYSSIQTAIYDAHTLWSDSGLHQVIHIRPGVYTEDLTILAGIRLVGDAEPQTTTPSSAFWGGAYDFNPTACVTVLGNHNFEQGAIRSSFRGIAFSAADSSANLFYAYDTDGAGYNIVQFFDCSFYQEPDSGSVSLFSAYVADTNFHFEDCKFVYYDGGWGGEMIRIASSAKFVRCSFDTQGFGGTIYLDGLGGTFLFEGCWLTVVNVWLSNGLSTLTYKETIHTGPQAYCIRLSDQNHEVYLINSTCIAQNGEAVVYSGDGGTVYYDKLSINPLGHTQIGFDAVYNVPITRITADQVRGSTMCETGTGTIYPACTYTAVAWDTSVGGGGTRIVQLPDAALSQGMMFTVWDSGGMAGTNDIVVASAYSAGGVTGPNTTISNDNASLLLLATINAAGQACWRTISYLY